jgi:hypothetical protein
MSDEEQNKLMAALRNPEHDRFPLRTARDAAVEIKRLAERLEAAHGYADECEDRIKMLNNQIDTMMRAQGVR